MDSLQGTGTGPTLLSNPQPPANADRYDASSITVLSGLDAVRRHPSMYIGSTGAEGLHHLVFELIDNAVDEAEAGHCRHISVVLGKDGSCVVEDDGRGIPVDTHAATGRPACEVLLTTLHSGAKFAGKSYATSAGLHGVGLSCVNALADWLRLEVRRDGMLRRQEFARGRPVTELVAEEPTEGHGTSIAFRPDPSVLDAVEFSIDVLVERLEEVAFLHPELTIAVRDERTGADLVLSYDGGVTDFLARRGRAATPVHPEPIVVRGASGALTLEAAIRWTDGYTEDVWSFVNTVRTEQGGAHIDGLRAALTAVVGRYAASHGLLDGLATERISRTDVLEGLNAVVAIRMANPKFDGQTKRRLESPEVGRFVQATVERALQEQFDADPQLGQQIIQRMLDASRARLAARLATRTARVQQRKIEIDYSVYQRQFGIRSKNWHDSCSWLTDDGLLAQHAALCDVPENARMLDVCCGSGVVGASFRGRVGEMVGLDITPEMVKLASTRLDEVHQGTVYDLPFEDGSFDLVVNREVLHLLPQPEQPVSEIYRVLRPGGQFIVGQIVPYADEDAFWMFRVFKKKQPLLFQMFREEEFRRLLLGPGFRLEEMKEYFLWESIDKWIDTHETTPEHRQQIYRLFYDAPAEVRAVHPFTVAADGSVQDRWRWCVYSLRKPAR